MTGVYSAHKRLGADKDCSSFVRRVRFAWCKTNCAYCAGTNVNGNLSTASTVTCGIPQVSIPGPLLFLMYINDLPNCLRVAAPRMFADDTSITLSAKTVADLKLAVTSELNNITCWLRANKLSLNVAKTGI